MTADLDIPLRGEVGWWGWGGGRWGREVEEVGVGGEVGR